MLHTKKIEYWYFEMAILRLTPPAVFRRAPMRVGVYTPLFLREGKELSYYYYY